MVASPCAPEGFSIGTKSCFANSHVVGQRSDLFDVDSWLPHFLSRYPDADSMAKLDGWKSAFSTNVVFAPTLFLTAHFVGIVEEAEARLNFGLRG